MSIDFPGPHTDRGVGVGSLFRDVTSRYSQLGAGDNEGVVYVWPKPDAGISFRIAVNEDSLRSGWQDAVSLIPDTARVVGLLIRVVEP